MILNLFLCTGTVYGYYCTPNQYRCDHRNNNNYYYYYYNDGTWGCINSTLACNGELDCRFDRSDEQGCGMFPRDDIITIGVGLHKNIISLMHVEYMYIHVLSTQRWGEGIIEFQGSIVVRVPLQHSTSQAVKIFGIRVSITKLMQTSNYWNGSLVIRNIRHRANKYLN